MTSPGLMDSTTRTWLAVPAPSLCRWRTTGSSPRRSGRSCFPRSSRSPGHGPALRLDAVGLQGLESVEAHRRVHRRIGARRENLDLVADLEVEWQLVLGLLVEDIGSVAGGTREHRRPHCPAVAGCADPVFNALVHGLGEAVELAHVEIDPALVLVVALARDQHHLALDHASIADDRAAGLHHELGQVV